MWDQRKDLEVNIKQIYFSLTKLPLISIVNPNSGTIKTKGRYLLGAKNETYYEYLEL
jgi:hypothetical protein